MAQREFIPEYVLIVRFHTELTENIPVRATSAKLPTTKARYSGQSYQHQNNMNIDHYVILLEDNTCDTILTKRIFRNFAFLLGIDNKADYNHILQLRPLDLIIAEYTLIEFAGFEALHMAKEVCPHVPFVYFSGHSTYSIRDDSINAGALEYVEKDNPERLEEVVRELFHISKAEPSMLH